MRVNDHDTVRATTLGVPYVIECPGGAVMAGTYVDPDASRDFVDDGLHHPWALVVGKRDKLPRAPHDRDPVDPSSTRRRACSRVRFRSAVPSSRKTVIMGGTSPPTSCNLSHLRLLGRPDPARMRSRRLRAVPLTASIPAYCIYRNDYLKCLQDIASFCRMRATRLEVDQRCLTMLLST